jgi:hypothetical protein
MTPVIKKHNVRRILSVFCSSSNFLSLLEEFIRVTPFLLRDLKERFYEAGIRISELDQPSRRAIEKRLGGLVV